MIIPESLILRKHVKQYAEYWPLQEELAELIENSGGKVNEFSIEARAKELQEIYPGLEILREDDTDLYKFALKVCLAYSVAYGTDPCTIDPEVESVDFEIDWGTPEEQKIYKIAHAKREKEFLDYLRKPRSEER